MMLQEVNVWFLKTCMAKSGYYLPFVVFEELPIFGSRPL